MTRSAEKIKYFGAKSFSSLVFSFWSLHLPEHRVIIDKLEIPTHDGFSSDFSVE
jgi:hypothetical protein